MKCVVAMRIYRLSYQPPDSRITRNTFYISNLLLTKGKSELKKQGCENFKEFKYDFDLYAKTLIEFLNDLEKEINGP
jgi:hypothetical protein